VGLSTIKPCPFKDKDVIDVVIIRGSSKIFGGKLTTEIFGAKGFVGSLKVKGHGSFLDVRLLKLKSTTIEKKMVKFEAHKRFQRCHS
jgi:hypothetical protein